MKKIFLGMALSIAALGGDVQEAHAQSSIFGKLGSMASGLLNNKNGESVKNAADMVSRLLGKDSLTVKDVQGEWAYSKPCVAIESEKVGAALGGALASQKLENTLDALMQKAGFSEGKLTLTLNADSTGCINMGGRDTQFTWKLEKTDLTFTFPLTGKEVCMNAKKGIGTLQISMNAERLLTFITAITEKAESLGQAPQSINALMKDVKGLYIGLKYTRKES